MGSALILLPEAGPDRGSWPDATHPHPPPPNFIDGVGGAWLGRTRIQDPGGKKRCSVGSFRGLGWFGGGAKLSEQKPGNTQGADLYEPKR